MPRATKEQREAFYQVVRVEKWTKIDNLVTAWKLSFSDVETRNGAINIVINHLKKSKETSTVTRVDYGMQLDVNDVKIDIVK